MRCLHHAWIESDAEDVAVLRLVHGLSGPQWERCTRHGVFVEGKEGVEIDHSPIHQFPKNWNVAVMKGTIKWCSYLLQMNVWVLVMTVRAAWLEEECPGKDKQRIAPGQPLCSSVCVLLLLCLSWFTGYFYFSHGNNLFISWREIL